MAQLVRALDSETCDSWAEHGSNPATDKGLSLKQLCLLVK